LGEDKKCKRAKLYPKCNPNSKPNPKINTRSNPIANPNMPCNCIPQTDKKKATVFALSHFILKQWQLTHPLPTHLQLDSVIVTLDSLKIVRV